MQRELVKIRRWLHQNAETGFGLPKTLSFVQEKLCEMGYTPQRCGKAGLVATLGKPSEEGTTLLRADMDALPIKEKTGAAYACKTGNMHACGHDLHTAMLLGAARLLKMREGELSHEVKLLFQPAEELLEGAKDVIKGGVLTTPNVTSAAMIHVLTDIPLPTGTLIVAGTGVSAPAADYFTITVRGKGCHGSAPQNGVDALVIASQILLALQTIHARELAPQQTAVLTVGSMETGTASNVLSEEVRLLGTLRAFDEDTREYVKKRMTQMANGIARAFRGRASVSYQGGCPTLVNDGGMSALSFQTLQNLFGKEQVLLSTDLVGKSREKNGGSEDFAYVSQKVPSVMIALAAGNPEEGYRFPLHHAKVDFDERALWVGSATYAAIGLQKK